MGALMQSLMNRAPTGWSASIVATAVTVLAAISGSSGALAAAGLPDPFQPPPGFREKTVAPSAPTSGTVGVADAPPPSLQMVLIGEGRKSAIIDGKDVEIGGAVGALKLTRLSATGADLSDGKKLIVHLTLPSAASAAATAASAIAVADAAKAASQASAAGTAPMSQQGRITSAPNRTTLAPVAEKK